MDILHLTYFVEVARQESFTKASETLFVSQSSISKLIKNLESELGLPLFDRTPRGVCLTEGGVRLFEKAKVILDTFHGIHDDLSVFTSTPRGRLRIGIPPLVQTLDNLPRIVAEFKMLPLITEIKPWHLAFAWKNTNLHQATRAWLEYAFQIFGIQHQVFNLAEHHDNS